MKLQEAYDWVSKATDDGWSLAPTYPNVPVSQAASLEKEGFVARTFMRPNQSSISVWGPDGMAVVVEGPYSWDNLKAALGKCNECGATGETVRLGFAGRVCPACRKKLAPKVEYPGWCD